MESAALLCFDRALAARLRPVVEKRSIRLIEVAPARMTPSPEPRAWARAVSELPLFNWLLLPTEHAVAALLEAASALPPPTVRLAALDPAAKALAAAGRTPDLRAASLGELVVRLEPGLGRSQRILVPHAAAAGRFLGDRLRARGADPTCVPAYDLAGDPETLTVVANCRHLAAILEGTQEAENLRALLGSNGRDSADRLWVMALTAAAADGAEDCGFSFVHRPERDVGPFLSETLSKT